MNLRSFIEECKRRKVFSSISIYALSAWVLIQVAATTFPYLGFPKIAITSIIILALILFPVVILFSWFYNVVPDPSPDIDDLGEARPGLKKRNKWTIIIISSLITLVIILLIIRLINSPSEGKLPKNYKQDNITVMEFENFTNDEDLDLIGKMSADWISHGIVQHKVGSVIEFGTLESYQELSVKKASILDISEISDLLKSNIQVIKGSYFIQNNQLIFQCRILDSNDPLSSYAFENTIVEQGDELKGIEQVTQKVLGYLSLRNDSEFSARPKNSGLSEIFEETKVPKYDAYQNYLTAIDVWRNDYKFSEQLLREALDDNPDFKQARDLLMRVLYNTRQYEELDSLIRSIAPTADGTKGEDVATYMLALLKGEHMLAYNTHKRILGKHPKDLNLNIEAMVTAMEFVNKPNEVIAIQSAISDVKFKLVDCSYCLLRDELLGRAYLSKGNYRYALNTLTDLSEHSNRRQTYELLIKAYIKLDRKKEVQRLLKKSHKLGLDKDHRYLFYIASRDYFLEGKNEDGAEMGLLALDKYKDTKLSKMKGRILYMMGNLDEAQVLFEELLLKRPSDTYSTSKLAQIYYRKGREQEALDLLSKMDQYRRPYQFGAVDYYLAQAYANMNLEEQAYEALEKAIQDGKRFQLSDFQNDPDFINIHDEARFNELLNYWH